MNRQPTQSFWVTTVATVILGALAFGYVGLVFAFWVMLIWYSIWSVPRRLEMLFLSLVGFGGAMYFLPSNFWPSINRVFAVIFCVACLIPLVPMKKKVV